MAKFHINRDRQSLGQFTPQEVADGLRDGKFLPNDLAWREGMEAWQPLSEITDLPPPLEAIDPLPEPLADGAPILSSSVIEDRGPIEPAWERRETLGFFPALFETIKQVFFNPVETFAAMKKDGGIASPLIFWLIMGSVTGIVAKLYNYVLIRTYLAGAANPVPGFPSDQWDKFKHDALASQTPGSLVYGLIFTPVVLVIVMFIGTGINHLCLMIVGGANRSFEVTFRALAFAIGTSSLLLLLPGCGGLIYMVWASVLSIIALKQAHDCATWKAVLGVLLPFIVCCLCLLGFGALAGFGMMAAMKGVAPH